jgi:hypothetical protein
MLVAFFLTDNPFPLNASNKSKKEEGNRRKNEITNGLLGLAVEFTYQDG